MPRHRRSAVSALFLALAGASVAAPAWAQTPEEITQALLATLPPAMVADLTYGTPTQDGNVIVIPDLLIPAACTQWVELGIGGPFPAPPVPLPTPSPRDPACLSVGPEIRAARATITGGRVVDGMFAADSIVLSGLVSSDTGQGVEIAIDSITVRDLSALPYAKYLAMMELAATDPIAFIESSIETPPLAYTSVEITGVVVLVDGKRVVSIPRITDHIEGDAAAGVERFVAEGITIEIPDGVLSPDEQAMLDALGLDSIVLNITGTARGDINAGEFAVDRLTFAVTDVVELALSLAVDGVTVDSLRAALAGDPFAAVPTRMAFSIDRFAIDVPAAALGAEAAEALAVLGLDHLTLAFAGGIEWNTQTGRFAIDGVTLSIDGLIDFAFAFLVDGLTLDRVVTLGAGEFDALPTRVAAMIDTEVTLPAGRLEIAEIPAELLGLDTITVALAGALDWNTETGTLTLDNFDFSVPGLARLALSLTVEGITLAQLTALSDGDPNGLPTKLVLDLGEASVGLPAALLAGSGVPLDLLGLDRLDVAVSGLFSADLVAGDFAITGLDLSVGGLAHIALSLAISGFTPDEMMALQAGDMSAMPKRIAIDIDDVSISVPAAAMEGEARAMLDALGLTSLGVHLSADIDWNTVTGALGIRAVTLALDGFGAATLSGAIEGLTPAVIHALQVLTTQTGMTFNEIQPYLTTITRATVTRLDIRYDDAGGVRNMLAAAAAADMTTVDVVIAGAMEGVRATLAALENVNSRNRIVAAIEAFLRNPVSLVIRARPLVPYTLADVYLFGTSTVPGQMLDPFALNVTVEANVR